MEILRGRRGESRWLVLERCLGRTSQLRAKRAFVTKIGKSFYKNYPRAGESTGSIMRLEETSILKLPNRFASTLTRKSTIEFLGLEDSTRVKRRGLSDIIGAKGWGPSLETLFAIIKIRFIKLMSIIKLISYLYQKTQRGQKSGDC